MDISAPSLVPRVVADLRPTADAAATVRTTAPPAAVAVGPAVPPTSPTQEALVARGLLDAQSVEPVGQPDPAGGPPDPTRPKAPPRVLKPWGVPMLPFEEHRRPGEPEAAEEPRPEAARSG